MENPGRAELSTLQGHNDPKHNLYPKHGRRSEERQKILRMATFAVRV